MSDVSVDIIKNRSGEAPDLPSGANLSGVSTAATLQVTNLNPTHINASGITTATTFSGSLKSTGTPTLGLGVTMNSSGLNISGVATAGIVSATTLYGDGSNLTGVAFSIAPISYNPDVNDSKVLKATGIGITFTELIKAGSGNITISVATNAGAAGTVVENFGVGSSVTINQNRITIDPTSDLTVGDTYHISYPSGAFTNTGGDVSYVGTAYTFGLADESDEMYSWGAGDRGQTAQNNTTSNSSPVQVPGTTWRGVAGSAAISNALSVKSDGTLWAFGYNDNGQLGDNSIIQRSSPTQIPGTNWQRAACGAYSSYAIKTDGTLWVWGSNGSGMLGVNQPTSYKRSSPVQVPGTTWRSIESGLNHTVATKTDGTLWCWGSNDEGLLGQNDVSNYSSPKQVPGTSWSAQVAAQEGTYALRTDGTLWAWGKNSNGQLGQNDVAHRSSPVQITGTWSSMGNGNNENMMTYSSYRSMLAIQTDGTLWGWGYNEDTVLGTSNRVYYSSPIQIGSDTTWSSVCSASTLTAAVKTDGTLWTWGKNNAGQLGINLQGDNAYRSSPVQVPGTDWTSVYAFDQHVFGVKKVVL